MANEEDVKKDIERLARLRSEMNRLSNEYNKISKKLGYGVRTGIISSSMRTSDDDVCYELRYDAEKKGLKGEEIDKYVEDHFDEYQPINIESSGYERWADIESSDYGWFPSGLNC